MTGVPQTWFSEGGRVKVVGVEPERCTDPLTAAIRVGRPVDAPAGSIAADRWRHDRWAS